MAGTSGIPTERAGKVRAILAGGMVLGVGASLTLAAWTDDEFASGFFSAGTFVFEGSADGEVFTDNPTAPGQTIAFEVGAANLSPGDSVSGAYTLRVGDESTTDATVVVNDDESVPAAGLTYSLIETDGHGCDADPVGAEIITDVPLGGASEDVDLGMFEVDTPRSFCITVTADEALEQGSTATGTWQFTATSE